jgi:hypothetical protein
MSRFERRWEEKTGKRRCCSGSWDGSEVGWPEADGAAPAEEEACFLSSSTFLPPAKPSHLESPGPSPATHRTAAGYGSQVVEGKRACFRSVQEFRVEKRDEGRGD